MRVFRAKPLENSVDPLCKRLFGESREKQLQLREQAEQGAWVMTDPLLVAIRSAESVDDKYVRFVIQCRKGELQWTVNRRYKDFDLLNKNLSKIVDSKDELPKLPPKKMRVGKRKFEKTFLNERRAALEGYLQGVADMFDPEDVPTFDDFLEYSENFMFGSSRALESITELRQVTAILRQAMTSSTTSSAANRTVASQSRSLNEYRHSDDYDGVEPSQLSAYRLSRDSDASSENGSVRSDMSASRLSTSLRGATSTELLEHATSLLNAHLMKLESDTEDLRTKYSGKLPLRTILDERLSATRKALADTKQLSERERVQRGRDCVVERNLIATIQRENAQLYRQIQLLQMEIDSLNRKKDADTAAFHTALADICGDFESGLEDVGVQFSVARGETVSAFAVGSSGRPVSKPKRSPNTNPFAGVTAVAQASSNPFRNGAGVTKSKNPFGSGVAASASVSSDTESVESLSRPHSARQSDAVSRPPIAADSVKLHTPPPPHSTARQQRLIPAIAEAGEESVLVNDGHSESSSSDRESEDDIAEPTPARAAFLPSLNMTEPERGVYVLPVCRFGSTLKALLICPGKAMSDAVSRTKSSGDVLVKSSPSSKAALASTRSQRTGFWKRSDRIASEDETSTVSPHTLPWQFISGACRMGESDNEAAVRLFREKAVRFGDEYGFTSACLSSVVAGDTFGSKTDTASRGGIAALANESTDTVRLSKMMTVVLTSVPAGGGTITSTSHGDFHGHWFELGDCEDVSSWKFADEQTPMFLRLGLLLSTAAKPPMAPKRASPLAEPALAGGQGCPSDVRHDSDASVEDDGPSSLPDSPPETIPCQFVIATPQGDDSVVGIGIVDDQARELLGFTSEINSICGAMEEELNRIASSKTSKRSAATAVKRIVPRLDTAIANVRCCSGLNHNAIVLMEQLTRLNVNLLQEYCAHA